MRTASRRVLAVIGAALAVGAWAHDDAASPHLSCALDGSDTLTCVYSRHVAGSERTSRAGYADKGRYTLSCRRGNSDIRIFETRLCRAGTGTATAFACWTQERLEGWLTEDAGNDAADREETTQLLAVPGNGIQETLLKLLVDPARVGRPNFIDGGADGPSGADIRDYAKTCGIGTVGALAAQDVVNLLPTLSVFGRGASR